MTNEDRLGVGIVGCGTISSLMAMAYLRLDEKDEWDNAYIYAAIDPRKSVAKYMSDQWIRQSGGKFNNIKIYTSLKEALNDPKIDVIVIATPENLHLKQSQMALEAEKHVSLQKVPTPTLREMDKIVNLAKAAEQRGIKFHVFENFRFHPPYTKMNEILKSGVCGELKSVFYTMITSLFEPNQWKVPLSTWKFHIEQSYNSPTSFDDGYHKHSLMNLWLGSIKKVREWRGQFKILGVLRTDSPLYIQYISESDKFGIWNMTMVPKAPMKSDYYGCDEFVRFECTDGLIYSNGCTGNAFVGAGKSGGVGEPGVCWYDKDGKWHTDCSMPTNWKYSFAYCGRYFIDETINGTGDAIINAEEARHILKVNIALVNSYRKNFKEIEVLKTKKVEGKAKRIYPWPLWPFWKIVRPPIKKE
ncbi:MAG: Gfo/Idh/MocA family protein [Candidatus Helarchaeota archaeon]